MEEQPEKTQLVLDKLCTAMDATVTAYNASVIQIESLRKCLRKERFVNGTSTFPVGTGLWRGWQKPFEPIPEYFPRSPIMIVGHNWGAVHEFLAAHRVGGDPMNGPSWRCLRRYLEGAEVEPKNCFFTNFFVGLQPERSLGALDACDEFKGQCREFLCTQIKIVRPCLIATIGEYAKKRFEDVKRDFPQIPREFPDVDLVHPAYACAGYNANSCDSIVAQEAAKLKAKVANGCRSRWLSAH